MIGDDLSTPRGVRRPTYNPELFGRFAETFARFLGTTPHALRDFAAAAAHPDVVFLHEVEAADAAPSLP